MDLYLVLLYNHQHLLHQLYLHLRRRHQQLPDKKLYSGHHHIQQHHYQLKQPQNNHLL
jgi:hypothetical protein